MSLSSASSASSEGSGAAQMPAAAKSASWKRQRGWEGQELEWDHQRSQGDGGNSTVAAAVDLSQFRNTEVGKGYQAKHVIRQPGANSKSTVSHKAKSRKTSSPSSPHSRTKDGKIGTAGESGVQDEQDSVPSTTATTTTTTSLQHLLQSAGMRQFRKEIESILSS